MSFYELLLKLTSPCSANWCDKTGAYFFPRILKNSLSDNYRATMSAFLPESDSEDELPPGWEERATLQGEVSNWQFWQPIIWEWNVLFCIPFITGLLCKPWPVLHTMATPEDRKEENSRRKLAIWLGEENSIGQQGISAFARMNLDNFAFWGCIRGLGQQEDHIHRPSIGFCKRNCHCLDNLPTKVWLWKHRFTGLWNHTMQVS